MQLPSIPELLRTRMNRKQFLRTAGMLLLAAIGLGALLRLNQPRHDSSAARNLPKDTYGS